MEEIAKEALISTSWPNNNFLRYEETSDIPSECILLQTDVDVLNNVEDNFLPLNIIKQESSSSCSAQHPFFATVSAFGDFISFSDDLTHKHQRCSESENVELGDNSIVIYDVTQDEIVVEEVAEQEIVSVPLDDSNATNEILYESRQNEYAFDSNLELNHHQCDFCNRRFTKKSSLRRHILLYHPELVKYECSECGSTFLRKKTLIKHFKQHSTNTVQSKWGGFSNIVNIEKNPKESEGFGAIDVNVDLSVRLNHCEMYLDTVSIDKSLHYHRCNLRNILESSHFKNTKLSREHEKSGCVSKIGSRLKNSGVCDYCGHKSRSVRDLKIHIQQHRKSINSPCFYCRKFFANGAAMMEHLCKVHNISLKDYVCVYCGKQCKDFRGLQKHSSVHFESQCLMCNVCEKQFCTKTSLKRHMNSHRDKAVTCAECGEKMPDSRALANHRASHNLVYSRDGALTARIFPCHTCNKVFGSRSSQQIHMRIHTGERPYNCRFCVKAFADGGTLRKHERIHTGEKPYACPICSKAFNQRVVLREHIRIHHANMNSTEEKFFKCEVCCMHFNKSQDLCSHLVKHSDDNTAKHRIPSTKPRKYKKWKVKAEENIHQKNSSEKLPAFKNKSNGIDHQNENSITYRDDGEFYKLCISRTEQNQVMEVCKTDDLREVQLFVSESNNCELPTNNEMEVEKWKNNELTLGDDKIFTIDVSYQLMNSLPNKFAKNVSDDETNTETSVPSARLKEIESHIDDANVNCSECSTKNELWLTLDDSYEFSFDSDLYVHSGLGLGATVELQSEF